MNYKKKLKKVNQSLLACLIFCWFSGNALANNWQDFYVPVIVMEKQHGNHPYLSRYRIEIYKNGRGYYYGLRDVRILGEMKFQIKPEQVVNLLTEFERLRFWQSNSPTYLPSNAAPVIGYQFIVRTDSAEKQIFLGATEQAVAMHQAIDLIVNSIQWRCPYVNAISQDDYCKNEEGVMKNTADRYRAKLDKEEGGIK